MGEMKKCRFCLNSVPIELNTCNYCGAVLNTKKDMDNDDSVVLAEVAANIFRGIEAVGGMMQITAKKIIFNSHGMNVQTGKTEILISNIKRLEGRKSLGIIPNKLAVIIHSGMEYVFVVNKRDQIIEIIEKQMKRN